MNKITVRLVGGLGNQLHCYAFGRAVAEQNRAILEVDCESGYWNDPYARRYLLDAFPELCVIKKSMPRGGAGRFFFKLKLRIGAWIGKLLPLRMRPVIEEDRCPLRYQKDLHRVQYKCDPYFLGYWASYRYYEDIAGQLCRDLSPPRPSDPPVLRMLEEIQSAMSCSIHWRSYAEEVGVRHPSLAEYYRKAVGFIKQAYPGTRFFVFSDNPEAARSLLGFSGENLIFVELKEVVGDLRCLNDFYLMYACDHAIIGDSTFSWWAAWLSDSDTKSIVAPRGLSPWGDDWLPTHWIAIDV